MLRPIADAYCGTSNKTSNIYTQFVKRTTSAQSLAGVTIYYDNTAIPYGVNEIYTINYYDDYNVDLPTGLTTTINK